MKTLQSPLFITSLVLIAIHQVVQKLFNINTPIISAYLDNLLAMPVILTLWQAERRFLFNQGIDFMLGPAQIIMATMYVAFISEVIFPILSRRFTTDWVDLLFYTTGSVCFYLTNKPVRSAGY